MTSKHPYKRTDRVADQLRQIISEALITKVHHRGLEGVTVTDVRVSADFQHATVYYRLLDEKNRQSAARELSKVSSIIQKELAQNIHTRYTPVLRFEYDESLDRGNRIESLLKSIQKNKAE